MARDEETHGGLRISSPDGGRMRAFGRFLATVAVIAAIFLVAGCFVVPLEGVRSFIEGWLGDRLGMELSIGAARIGLPYVLVIEKTASADFDGSAGPGFSAREIRIGLGWKTRLKVSADKCVLRLVDSDRDAWKPEVFARLGIVPMSGVGEISRATESFRHRMSLRVTDGTVTWVSGVDGGVIASAGGVSFSVEPAGIPGRRMYHHRLSVYGVTHPDGTRVGDVEREWLASDAARYVELHRSPGDLPRSVRDFWDPPLRRGPDVAE